MNSLNSVHIDNIMTTEKHDTSICKNPNEINQCDSSSIILLKKIDAPSPDIPGIGKQIFSPFKQLVINFYIAAFIRKLNRFIKPDQHLFKPKHYGLINDKAAGNQKDFMNYFGSQKNPVMQFPKLEEVSLNVRLRFQFKQLLTGFQHKCLNFFEGIPLIDPGNKIKVIWDLLLSLYRVYLIFIIPIIITFEQLIEDYDLIIIASQILFAVDLLLRNFTIYYEQGLPVIDRYQIVKNQYHLTNLIELIQICLLFLMAYFKYSFNQYFVLFEGWPKLTMLIYFIQIKNLMNFISSWQQSILIGKSTSSLIELLKLLSLLLLIQHFFSCVWLIIGRYNQLSSISNWITVFEFNQLNWYELYIQSMYFTSITMYTVGYGDVHPTNDTEKLFACVFVLICTFQTSLSLNIFGEILAKLKNNNDIINKKLIFINQYMHNKKISNNLQMQVREYLNYYWYKEQTQQTKEQTEILSQLSDELRKQIAVESNSIVLKNCNFFDHFSNEFVKELLKHLYFQSYQPGSTINTFLDDDYYMYIVESGQVDVYDKSQTKKILLGQIKTGEYFGLSQFIHSQSHDCLEYKSSSFVSTLVIQQSKFLTLLNQYQNDFEIYWNLKVNNFNSHKCTICESKTHQADLCKQVHFVPDREKVMKKYIYEQNQNRERFLRNARRERQLFHAQSDQEILREAAEMVRVKNESAFFLKYSLQDDETTQFESKEVIKKQVDSVGLLIKDLQSQSILEFSSRSRSYQIQSRHESEKKFTEINEIKNRNQEDQYTLMALKEKLHHKDLYSEFDIEQMEYLIKILEIKLSQDDQFNIDICSEFTTFNTKANVNTVIKKIFNPVKQVQIKSSTSKSLDQYTLVTGQILLKYMLFPHEFITQYRTQTHHRFQRGRTLLVRQQERRLSSALLKKKQGLHKSKRNSIQVFPIK